MITADEARLLTAEWKGDLAKRVADYTRVYLEDFDRRIRKAAGLEGDFALIDFKVRTEAAEAVAAALRAQGFHVYINGGHDGYDTPGIIRMDVSWTPPEDVPKAATP